MARSPLTETINRVQGMITYARENLSTDEYMLFLDLLIPEPEVAAAPAKKKRKRSKSPRAASLATAIGSRALEGGVSKMRCTHVAEDGDDPTACGEYTSNPIHDEKAGYGGYHPFAPPAQSARGQSSRNGQQQGQAASSATETVDVGDAPAGLSGSEKALV